MTFDKFMADVQLAVSWRFEMDFHQHIAGICVGPQTYDWLLQHSFIQYAIPPAAGAYPIALVLGYPIALVLGIPYQEFVISDRP